MSSLTPNSPITLAQLEDAVRRIVETAHPARVILFGSHSRGEATPESDIDLMVVEDGVKDTAGEALRLRRSLRSLLIAVDIVVVDRKTFEYWRDTPGNVYYEAAVDGIALYEAH